jgi:hypothetical protein
MIISFKKNFLFIHIPKCAGESITELLLDTNNYGGQFLKKHSTYSQAERLLGKELKRFNCFAVVRNPYEQVFSFYEHLRKPLGINSALLEQQYPGSGGKLQPEFASRIAMECDFNLYVKTVYSKQSKVHVWMCDLCDWLTDIEGKIAITHILQYERLNQDFQLLSRYLNLVGTLQWRNCSRDISTISKYRLAYDAESRSIVQRHFCRTIDTFGYEF